MMAIALHLTLILLTLAFSILAVELKDMLKAILSFTVANVFLSAILYLLGAHYLAVFQLLIYAGAVTILFLATIHAGEERGD
ncbi:MAG: NADH-quinone oxidoreductase subunit J [Thaumarchaeota archaeon]|nr:NADH-quinone oxidoreductase subunit J [Nitrososphaerota archaeon]